MDGYRRWEWKPRRWKIGVYEKGPTASLVKENPPYGGSLSSKAVLGRQDKPNLRSYDGQDEEHML